MNLQEILMHFCNVKNAGENLYRADCPACGDTKQHLYISEVDGKILVDCKKRCTFHEIVSASGLKASDFFDKQQNNQNKERWKLLRTHIYTNLNGDTIAKKEIYNKGE